RLLPALASLLAIALFFTIVRRVAGRRLAGLAALALAAMPMVGVYGGLVNYEPFVLAATCATYLAYLRWRETGARRDLALVFGGYVLAILLDWFGAFVGAAIGLHALLVRPRAP